MIPGLASRTEQRLRALLAATVTDITEDAFVDRDFVLLDAHEPDAKRLGITCATAQPVTIVVTDPDRNLGHIRIEATGTDGVLFFDNVNWGGNCYAELRILGAECFVFFNDIGAGYVALPTVLLRSHEQFLFWGRGATAVGLSIEMEGEGRGVVIGDDALISSGVWIRNYDMHAIHDLSSGRQINRPPTDTVIERHVWLGQDALLLGCDRIGMGSIIGARSLVKGTLPARVTAAGTPARVIRHDTSWGRGGAGMTGAERRALGLPEQPPRDSIDPA